jgi:predicted house-cleaning noncanonical NTP pyrophosphatase (MazG superfamily)
MGLKEQHPKSFRYIVDGFINKLVLSDKIRKIEKQNQVSNQQVMYRVNTGESQEYFERLINIFSAEISGQITQDERNQQLKELMEGMSPSQKVAFFSKANHDKLRGRKQ